MNVDIKPEKTNYLRVQDKEIKVSSLPESVRFEVDTLDRYVEKKMLILHELEIIELAIKAKQAHLSQLVTTFLDDKDHSHE